MIHQELERDKKGGREKEKRICNVIFFSHTNAEPLSPEGPTVNNLAGEQQSKQLHMYE